MRRAALPNDHHAGGILGGLRAFGGGVGFIIGTPSVWGYALVPITMAFVLLFSLGALGIWGAFRAGNALFGGPTGFWAEAGSWVVTVVLALVALLAALLLALALAQPLSAFALDAIVHARERALSGSAPPKPGKFHSMFQSFKANLITVGIGAPVLAVLFCITWLFPPAAVVTVPLKFLVLGWMLAWDFLDYPLSIHGLGLRARCRWIVRNFDAFTAFGLVWALLVIVPGVVLLLLPMGVAGATEMVVASDE